ncbi:MAG: serine/threonine protein kinase [Myxococcales bacterium]|nr:serine/threonine protein kinase [Myxococcales bacterium]
MAAAMEERLGPYRLLRLIGEGGMARIYLAEHEKLSRLCAIKRLHASHFDDPVIVARFLAEARAVADIDHPNLIAVHDVIEGPDEIYLVMDYFDGRDVAQVLREEGPFEPARAAEIAAEVCDGLAAVHVHEIIHRDLKPENVFLASEQDGRERVKLLDFGVARLTEQRPKELRTRSGLTVGTPTYMSPEQATAGAIGARSDLYAVGVLLFEMITGKPPFTGVYGDVMLKHVNDPPPSLSARRPGVPAWLEALVMRCLAKEPDDRFQSATELAAALRTAAGRPALGEAPRRRRPVRRWTAIAAGCGGLAVLIVAGVAMRSSPRPPGVAPAPPVALPAKATVVPVAAPPAPPPVTPPPAVREIRVETLPVGARVSLDRQFRCVAPCVVALPTDRLTAEVEVVADGFVAQRRMVEVAAPPDELRLTLRRRPTAGLAAPRQPGKRPGGDRNATVDPFQ